VRTIAANISGGINHPNSRVHRFPDRLAQAIPISRFQPKCRLGIAAYWLVKAGG
jgi:hypothetical protein